jgi:hypothetical protein
MDEPFRSAGRSARTEIEAAIDVDAAWSELTGRIAAGDEPSVIRPIGARRPDRARRWIVVVAAAASVALVVGIAVFLGRPDTVRTEVPTTGVTTTQLPVQPEPAAPASTTPPVTTGSTTTAATTTASPPATADPDAITVSYLDPPPEATLIPVGSYPYASPGQTDPRFVVGETGVAIVHWQESIWHMSWDGEVREVGPLPELASFQSPLAGPGDVLYALENGMVAIALSGDREGEIVARRPIPDTPEPLFTADLTSGIVHGPTGVVLPDVANGDVVMMEYVDETGAPRTWDGAPSDIPRGDSSDTAAAAPGWIPLTVVQGDVQWLLEIERDPEAIEPYNGFGRGIGPGPGDTVIHATTIGAALQPGEEYSENAGAVVAVLRQDGSGSWLAIPEGWQYEAASPWGVLVSQLDTADLEIDLALLDLRPPPVDPLAAFATQPAPIDIVCDPGTVCVRFDVDASGVVTSSRLDTDEVVRWTDPPVAASSGLVQAWLIAVGPDDVAYLAPSGTDESGVDVVAVSLAAADAGREIRRWPAVLDISGDTELIPTPAGLVAVGCCGPDQLRPDPDAAAAVPWISRNGAEITADIPVVLWDLTTRTVTVDDRSWEPDLTDAEGLRGMPLITPTADGGFLGAFESIDGGSTVIVRGLPDGTSEQVRVTSYPVLLHRDGTVWFVDPTTGRVEVTAPFAG